MAKSPARNQGPLTDDAFNALLAACQEDYDNASSNWKPDPGEYTVMLADIHKGIAADKDDPSKRYFYIRPTWEIIGHTNLNGVKFAGDFLTNRNNISLSILKGFIETLLGRASGRLSEDVTEVMTCIGVTCVVQIVQSKNGQYKNDRLKEVIADIDPSETGNESPV
jgi:hypothetical protein